MATAQLDTLMRHLKGLAAGRVGRHRTDRQLLDEFAAWGDESAFAALLSRHGPTVLRVCRRVLRHEQDAEDAFQATFLVLARNTASVRKREALASWLYGVAYRTAMEAKRKAARRRSHEARLRERTPPAAASPTWDDVQAVLDEEVQRLPESFRAAFVLCVLGGKTVPAAAAELGAREGTVSWRLARARQRLRQRLARRGIQLSAVLAALSVTRGAGEAAVPAALASSAVRFGLSVAAGGPAAAIPSHVAALAAGVTRAMFLNKAKTITALLLVAGLLVAGAGALVRQALAAGEPPAERQTPEVRGDNPGPAAAKQVAGDKDAVTYGGHVVGSDGRPVAGAKLYLTEAHHYPARPSPLAESATTGADGRFQFTAPKAKYGGQDFVVTAAAANYGAGWVTVPASGRGDDLTLQLVNDDTPVTGQIVDLQGKPVPDATLTVLQIHAAVGDDLGPWLDAVKDRTRRSFDLERLYFKRSTTALPAKATTDAEGRFRLTGVGRDRLVRAFLEGPAIASQYLHLLARPGKTIEATEFEGRPEYGDPRRVTTYYAADFRHVASPTRPVVGVVRDKDTKKPLAGVKIWSLKVANDSKHLLDSQAVVRTTTDAQGRYRLTGLPKGEGNVLMVMPPDDLPYVAVRAEVPGGLGLDPVTVDVELRRGIWVEGKVTDKVTGKPVRAGVQYVVLYSNPHLSAYPGFEGWPPTTAAVKEDGSYRLVALPGPGMVAAFGQENHYLRAPQREDEYGVKGLSDEEYPIHLRGSNCAALSRVDPAKGADSVKRDVTLDPGWKFTGTVLGPDDKPLAGARSFLLVGHWWDREATRAAEFGAWFNPRETSEILFQHPEKGLVGVARPPKENGGAVTVRLAPGAMLTGRLVGADGKPRASVELEVTFRPAGWGSWFEYSAERVKTDREGRFRVEGLLPDRDFRLSDGKGRSLAVRAPRSGRAADLGDVEMKPVREDRE
jgi:RNA polymerase sigma factor (sigma-70 family)